MVAMANAYRIGCTDRTGYREARRKNEDSSTSIIQHHLQKKKPYSSEAQVRGKKAIYFTNSNIVSLSFSLLFTFI